MSCVQFNLDRLAAFSSMLSLISAFISFIIAMQILREGDDNGEDDEIILLRNRIEVLEDQITLLNNNSNSID